MLPVPIKNSALSVRTRASTTPSPDTQSVTTTKKRQPTWMNTLELYTKQLTRIPQMQHLKLPGDICKYVICDAEEVTWLGSTEFVRRQQGRGDFASMSEVEHPARRLLRQYKHRGVLVMLMTGGVDRRGTSGGPGTGTPQVCYQTRPFSPQVIHLNVGEGSVDGAPLLGCQTATRTQVDPARGKIGKG